MKATEANLLKFLEMSPQFVIPIYQRNYSWLPDECRQLWADLLHAGRNDGVAAHFIARLTRSTVRRVSDQRRGQRQPWSPVGCSRRPIGPYYATLGALSSTARRMPIASRMARKLLSAGLPSAESVL